MCRILLITVLLLASAAATRGGEVYLRDGVTDGDTFYLADSALRDDDPILQSWVSYSLTRSACQLQIGGDNPARASSFECEYIARQHLLETWRENRIDDHPSAESDAEHEYLNALLRVEEAGYLAEYVARYFHRKAWDFPEGLRMAEFHGWRRDHLRGHKPRTRLIGSWNYADKVGPVLTGAEYD